MRDENGYLVAKYWVNRDVNTWVKYVRDDKGNVILQHDSKKNWKKYQWNDFNRITHYEDSDNLIIDLKWKQYQLQPGIYPGTNEWIDTFVTEYKDNKGNWFNYQYVVNEITNQTKLLAYKDSNNIWVKSKRIDNIVTEYKDCDNYYYKYIPNVSYEDSDGNYWNQSMNIEFPYEKNLVDTIATHLCTETWNKATYKHTELP